MNAIGQTREQYLSDLAHDPRNPLASIVSSVELMQALGQHAEEIPRLLGVVDEKAMTMANVLDDFLVASSSQDAFIRGECDRKKRIPLIDLRVLVVDDNTTAADSLGQLLMLRGYDVQVAYGGEEALRKAEEFLPQVAILDIGMPDIDGYKLREMLREKHSSCTYIALTGYGFAEDLQRTTEADFDFHITKPTRIEDIHTILQKVIAKLQKASPTAR